MQNFRVALFNMSEANRATDAGDRRFIAVEPMARTLLYNRLTLDGWFTRVQGGLVVENALICLPFLLLVFLRTK